MQSVVYFFPFVCFKGEAKVVRVQSRVWVVGG